MSTSRACIAFLRAGLKTSSKEKDKNKNFQLKFEVFPLYDWLLNKYLHISLCIQPTSNIPYSKTAVLMAFNILHCQNMLSLKAAIIKKKI